MGQGVAWSKIIRHRACSLQKHTYPHIVQICNEKRERVPQTLTLLRLEYKDTHHNDFIHMKQKQKLKKKISQFQGSEFVGIGGSGLGWEGVLWGGGSLKEETYHSVSVVWDPGSQLTLPVSRSSAPSLSPLLHGGVVVVGRPCARALLQVVPGLVLRLGGREVVLQEGLEVLEGGPLVRLLLPADPHHLVQGVGAARGAGHPVAALHLLQNLPVHHAYRTHRHSSR